MVVISSFSYTGLRAVLSDLIYSPVHQTGEIFQGHVKTPSMSRYQTFREFNAHREMQERGRLQISDPIPYRRTDTDFSTNTSTSANLTPSFPPTSRRSAEDCMPDVRKQLYDAPLGYIPRDPFSSPQPSSSFSTTTSARVSPNFGRSSRERSPIPPPPPPPLNTSPSFDVAVDYRSMPLYRQQTSSHKQQQQRRQHKARPNPPGPRPVQGANGEDGSVSQYSVQSAYPAVSPGPEEAFSTGYLPSPSKFRQAAPSSRSNGQYRDGNENYASASSGDYRRSPIYSRPVEYDDRDREYGTSYQQPQASSSRTQTRERTSPNQPGANNSRVRNRTPPRNNRYGWSSGLGDNLL